MGCLDFVVNGDQQPPGIVRVGIGSHFLDLNAWLPHCQRFFDIVGRQTGGTASKTVGAFWGVFSLLGG